MASRVLVVCTGNVCRSPYLHRRLQLALSSAEVQVSSAGTGALSGEPMDPRMAVHLGDEADPGFRAHQVTRDDVQYADLVLTATREHRALVARLHPRALRTTFAAADFAHLARAVDPAELPADLPSRVAALAATRARLAPLPPERADIPDPFRRSPDDYAAAALMIDGLVPDIVAVLR